MATAKQVLKKARKLIGTPYAWGGNNPTTGFDCSGYVNYIFKAVGINVGRTTYDQIKKGEKINNKADLLPGDLIFFMDKNNSPYHVVIYTGNNNMIESPRTGLNVRERNLYRWDGVARRVLDSNAVIAPPIDNKIPAPQPPLPTKTFLRVVCGSFERKDKALKRQAEIKKVGFDTFLLAYKKDGTTYFRVICGSFNSRIKANERQSKLKEKGLDTFLFTYNP
ncbi:NlpC/P60 family protein [uncultured Clostridium sp.]|jgi:hypothetical protein|uniref:NlpC/P60 family protein n=1 Tax=uncultured Clostridium sp. TaxID=59620 RepID=UPI002602BB3F|nr:NlpC/P60 family protein [uncultured Clostridium sp.]